MMKPVTQRVSAGVIGFPVAHSLSPRLHGYWLHEHSIDGEYARYEVRPEMLGDFLKNLENIGLAGCNLTLPHKEAAVAYMDDLDSAASAIGAVNTVVFKQGKLLGSNTDAYGFISNLKAHISLPDYLQHAVVLGAGGAAKAVVFGLIEQGCTRFTLMNRTQENALRLQQQFRQKAEIASAEWGNWSALETATLLVNTTALGMQGKESLVIDLQALPRSSLVTDIVYTPRETALLGAARARGNTLVDGLGMLLHQGVPGFAAWFGVRPQVTPALIAHMQGV